MRCVDQPHAAAGVGLCHAPTGRTTFTHGARECTIAGHVHPCVRLRDVDGSSLRVPCFVFSDNAALLPAFGSFTGAHPLRPCDGDRIFTVGHGLVSEIATVRA